MSLLLDNLYALVSSKKIQFHSVVGHKSELVMRLTPSMTKFVQFDQSRNSQRDRRAAQPHP